MVQDQGAIVDRVEHHINISSDYVATGAHGLKKAKTLKDKYRTKKMVLIFLLLVLVGVVAVVIAVSVENSDHSKHHHHDVIIDHHHDVDHHQSETHETHEDSFKNSVHDEYRIFYEKKLE